MPISTTKYTFQLLTEIAGFSKEDGSLKYRIVDIQEGNWSNDQETTYAKGLNGANIDAADRNKSSKLTATNGTIVEGLLAAQVGGTVTSGAIVIDKYLDTYTAASSKITLTKKPQGATGAEIDYIYKINADGSAGTKYEQGATASATEFSYTAASGEMILPTSVFTDGDTVLVQYSIKATNAKKISNDTDKFTENDHIVARCWARSACDGKSYPALIIFKNAKVAGKFEVAFGNDFAVHNFEADALQDCGNTNLWDFVVFDDSDVEKIA